jgi:parvulin-like peptidyl-prolyl isomerase
LKEGAISEPIKGMFGTTLVKVVKIEPDQVKKFEDVAAGDQADGCGRPRPQRDRHAP